MEMEKEKVFVTGGTGLIGGHLIEQLIKEGHPVRALSRKTSDLSHLKTTGAEIVFGDIEDYNSIKDLVKGYNTVIHAAARVQPGWGPWEEFEKTIINGTKNFIEACIAGGAKRFVYLSSITVYGSVSWGRGAKPVDETVESNLEKKKDTYYDYAKMLTERMVMDYHKQGKIQVTVVRPSSNYGPRCRLLTDRIYTYVRLLPLVFLPGDALGGFSLVNVKDTCKLIILATFSDKAIGQIYNAGPPSDQQNTYADFILAMGRALGKPKFKIKIPLFFIYILAVVMETYGKITRAKNQPFLTRSQYGFVKNGLNISGDKAVRELGWKLTVSLDEGCREYVEWRKADKKKKKESKKGNKKGIEVKW